VAVADHNSRPWEEIENDDNGVGESLVNTPVSDLFEEDDNATPSTSTLDPHIPIIGAAEMHDFHENRP
jgi:hypothetical protein